MAKEYNPKDSQSIAALLTALTGPCEVCNNSPVDENRIAALEAIQANAWNEGKCATDREWETIWDIVTPDEDRYVAVNPYTSRLTRRILDLKAKGPFTITLTLEQTATIIASLRLSSKWLTGDSREEVDRTTSELLAQVAGRK
jgi:hypothetical protein